MVSHLPYGCYTYAMPTAHRRHAVTETDDIGRALEVARRTWPDLADRPGALLRELILIGRDTLAHDAETVAISRRDAVDETAGALAGVYGPDYRRDLREDWPE